MQKEAAGGRVSFELMGGTQSQESYSFLHASIWRTVSFQALPRKVLNLRNYLLVLSTLLLAVDAFDCWLYAQEYQVMTLAK